MKKLVSLLLVSILSCTLIACGGDSPSSVVEKFYSTLMNGNISEISNLINKDTISKDKTDKKLTSEEEEALKKVLSKTEIKINNTEEKNDEATVSATVTAIDAGDIMGNYMVTAIQKSLAASMSGKSDKELQKDLQKDLINIVNKDDLKKITQDINIQLIKQDNKWVIKDPETVLLKTFNLEKFSKFIKEFSNK